MSRSKFTGTDPKTKQSPVKQSPATPPAYRPQPTPRVLQAKKSSTPGSDAGSTRHAPVAPPAYRPQPTPKVLQRKVAAGRPTSENQSHQAPKAPAVYRPQASPGVLQRMQSQASSRLPLHAGPLNRLVIQRMEVPVEEHTWTEHYQCAAGELFSIRQSSLDQEEITTCDIHNQYYEDVSDRAESIYYCGNSRCSQFRMAMLTADACAQCGKAKRNLEDAPCYTIDVEEEVGKTRKQRQRGAVRQQLAKPDNSSHGKHKFSIPKGAKGDGHQVGQDRKTNRVKKLQQKLDNL